MVVPAEQAIPKSGFETFCLSLACQKPKESFSSQETRREFPPHNLALVLDILSCLSFVFVPRLFSVPLLRCAAGEDPDKARAMNAPDRPDRLDRLDLLDLLDRPALLNRPDDRW